MEYPGWLNPRNYDSVGYGGLFGIGSRSDSDWKYLSGKSVVKCQEVRPKTTVDPRQGIRQFGCGDWRSSSI